MLLIISERRKAIQIGNEICREIRSGARRTPDREGGEREVLKSNWKHGC
jgi:hypothetical protein